jgi:hypothetical protein
MENIIKNNELLNVNIQVLDPEHTVLFDWQINNLTYSTSGNSELKKNATFTYA